LYEEGDSREGDEEDSKEWKAIWPYALMLTVLPEPAHPFEMTAKLTA
jgi:hypothetical protein